MSDKTEWQTVNSTNDSLARPPGPVTFAMWNGILAATCNEGMCIDSDVHSACKHVFEFYKNRHELVAQPLPERHRVDVPLFRRGSAYKHLDIVVTVSIGEVDEWGNRPFALATPEGVEKEVIDTLSPSSGVWAMRNSILQWAFSLYRSVQDCSNPTHRRSWAFAPGAARVHDATSPSVLSDIVCIMANGKCTRCTFDKDTSLVPDL